MAIQIFELSVNTSTGNAVLEYFFRLKEHLVSVGWIIPQSSNGTTGGSTGGAGSGGAGDHITSASSLSQFSSGVSESWFILREPNGLREILIFRYSSDDKEFGMNVTEGAVLHPFSGPAGYPVGNAPTGPAGSAQLRGGGSDIFNDGSVTFHFGADDTTPFGWWAWCHNAGFFSEANDRHGLAHIPITQPVPNDIDPVVWMNTGLDQGWRYTEFDNSNASSISGRAFGYNPNTGTIQGMSAWYLRDATSGVIVPRDIPPDSNGDDVSFPVFFGRPGTAANGVYKGASDFIQSNGMLREAGETFAGKTRVSVGDFNFGWDGVTTPTT